MLVRRYAEIPLHHLHLLPFHFDFPATSTFTSRLVAELLKAVPSFQEVVARRTEEKVEEERRRVEEEARRKEEEAAREVREEEQQVEEKQRRAIQVGPV